MADLLVYREFAVDAAIRMGASGAIGAATGAVVWAMTTGDAALFGWWTAARPTAAVGLPTGAWLITVSVALLTGALVVSVLSRWLPGGKVSGPPDTLHGLADPDYRVAPRTGVLSTLIAAASTSSGASVGLYGPLIHFGSVLADGFRRLLGTERISWPTLVGCGVGAAISAAFLTPIGAALFATEFVMRRISLRDFLPLAVASSSAWGTALALGSNPVFAVGESLAGVSVIAVVIMVLLGVVLGGVAVGFTRLVETAVAWGARVPGGAWVPLWAAVVMIALGSAVPPVLGTGVEFVQEVFAGRLAPTVLVIVLAAKVVATAACVGLRFYGGLFAPSLFIGALCGALAGAGMALVPVDGVAGMAPALPVICAFAVASALVGAPFAGSIILLEMTQSYAVAALGFAACVTASYVYAGFAGRSFFDRRLRDRGLDYEESQPVRRTRTTPVRAAAASLEEVRARHERERVQIDRLEDDGSILRLPPDMSALHALDAMDRERAQVAQLEADAADGDPRRYLHRAQLHELAWELTVTDSQAGILGGQQSRDFVSLTESDLARDLNGEELDLMERCGRLRVIHAGDVLIEAGATSNSFFILNAGLMRIVRDGDTLAWLHSGGVVGEVSFLTRAPRSADVIAERDSIVQEFMPEFMAGADAANSDVRRALQKLARRRGVELG